MALLKGTNSLATLEEAEAYFLNRLDSTAWTETGDLQKSQALVTGTSILNEQRWAGVAVSDTQLLAFPRSGSYFDPRIGRAIEFTSATPARALHALYEIAFHLLNNDGLFDDTGDVSSLEISGIKLSKIRSASKIPHIASILITPLLENAGSKLWWRAN